MTSLVSKIDYFQFRSMFQSVFKFSMSKVKWITVFLCSSSSKGLGIPEVKTASVHRRQIDMEGKRDANIVHYDTLSHRFWSWSKSGS